MTDAEAIERTVVTAVKTFGRLDIVFANAGIGAATPIGQTSLPKRSRATARMSLLNLSQLFEPFFVFTWRFCKISSPSAEMFMLDHPLYRRHVLDYLGLVAGMFDELSIGDVLDQAMQQNPELRDVTVGEGVKAFAHLDSTGFHVDGRYNGHDEPDEHVIHITRGYSGLQQRLGSGIMIVSTGVPSEPSAITR